MDVYFQIFLVRMSQGFVLFLMKNHEGFVMYFVVLSDQTGCFYNKFVLTPTQVLFNAFLFQRTP